MRRFMIGAALAAAVAMPMAGANAEEFFHANFSGFQELGGLPTVANPGAETGAILSEGTATLQLQLDNKMQTLTFTLKFSGLSSTVTQAHIHFGQQHVPGGVIVFFCATPPTPAPAGTQSCGGGRSGTITGTLRAGDVIGPAGQGIAAGNFDGLEDALNNNTAYANIHTTNFPQGEIRGQITPD